MQHQKPIVYIIIGIICIIAGVSMWAISHPAHQNLPFTSETAIPPTNDITPPYSPSIIPTTPAPPVETDPGNTETLPSRGDSFIPITSYMYNDVRLPMPLSIHLQEYTYCMAEKHNIPFHIIMGVLGAESGWDESITTRTNEVGTFVGMGALRDIYHAERFAKLGIDIYTPEGNIEAVCILIYEKLDMFDGNIHYALMAYNWGPNTTRKKIAEGIHESTYSQNVLRYANSFQ